MFLFVFLIHINDTALLFHYAETLAVSYAFPSTLYFLKLSSQSCTLPLSLTILVHSSGVLLHKFGIAFSWPFYGQATPCNLKSAQHDGS